MESDPTRMCALLVGLLDVIVNGVGDWPKWLRIEISSRVERPLCGCGKAAHRHGIREVVLVDLPCFGRPTRSVSMRRSTCARAATAASCGQRRSSTCNAVSSSMSCPAARSVDVAPGSLPDRVV